MKETTIVILGLFIAGCGGGSDSGSAVTLQPPGGGIGLFPVNDSPGGIWTGTDSDGDELALLVAETGRFHFIDQFLRKGFGSLSVSNGNDVDGDFQFVAPSVTVFPNPSPSANCTASGSVNERISLTLTVNCTTAAGTQDSVTVALTYDASYDRDSSLATISGLYRDQFGGNVLDISANGSIFQQDPTGCTRNGQISIINSAYNAYDVEMTLSNCVANAAALEGATFTGLATLDDSATPELAIFAVTGTVNGVLFSNILPLERI